MGTSDNTHEATHGLTPRKCRIFEKRFGLEDGVRHTREEVGREFDITRERVRQVEEEVFEKIRQEASWQELCEIYRKRYVDSSKEKVN